MNSIPTNIINAPLFREDKSMTKIQAFAYMIDTADENGVIYASLSQLANVFLWDRNRVYRFIVQLKLQGFTEQQNEQQNEQITISNIESYRGEKTAKRTAKRTANLKSDPLKNDLFLNDSLPFENPSKKSPPKPKKESTALYSKMMALYSDWFKGRNNGLPPNINAVEGASLKKIIAYFEPLVYSKAKEKGVTLEKGSEEADNEVINAFKLIFNQWETMDDFLKNGVKLSQINSNLTNIINQLRNKNGKLTKADKQAAAVERNKQEWAEILSGNLDT